MKLLVTGGAGFIGSAFIRRVLATTDAEVVIVDKLTYAGNLESIALVLDDPRCDFERVDICDRAALRRVFEKSNPDAVLHFAAESHVDRSISNSDDFIQTNIVGTHRLLEEARHHYDRMSPDRSVRFRFLHVSTDEVFGALGPDDPPFTERTPYAPNSPYAASKAASDHLVRAWHHTHRLPTLTTNCSNNYGPYQNPEKLIPRVIDCALGGIPIPVYGTGTNVRDWLHVHDHVDALLFVLKNGTPGESYNIGGNSERQNIEIVKWICDSIDLELPQANPRSDLISFVGDRAGHDFRYAIDAAKLEALGWRPKISLMDGIRQTVDWYIQNPDWVKRVKDFCWRHS